MSSKQQEKLIELLRELFQLNQPDLDFGLYRIMHAKSREIEQFLNEDLLATIQQRLGGNKAEKVEKAKAAYERERQNAIDYGGNPDTAPKAMQSFAEYKAAQESQDDDEDLYEQLYRFFERYYDGGDFLSRRYYGRETSEKGAPYAVPYDGSEVYLHWANKDQYYIKTTESFRQFSVDLAQAKLNAAELFTSHAPVKLHFTLVEAEEGVHNNVKATNDKERYFIVDADAPLEWQGDELTVRFHYRADKDKPAKGRNWREERNKRNEAAILAALEKQAAEKGEQAARAQRYHQALNADIPKGKDNTQRLLAKYLNQYTAKNSMDYFIHKDLGSFLKRELDYYLKNELFRLDELGSEKQPNTKNYERQLQKALTLREVAHKLIEFLAQTEEFQKKLWLKKKFVVDTQWLITLDKVPASFYPQIEAKDAQWSEWERLGFIAAKAKRKPLLKSDSKLVLDTQFFDTDFTAQLLEHISNTSSNLDEATDGVLVHSENFQALKLMQERYREQVKCIYIDPPYNTDASAIMYKNGYKDSSWLSLMNDRLIVARSLMSDDALICVAIDDEEVTPLRSLLSEIFIKEVGISVVKSNPQSRKTRGKFSPVHEYALFFGKTEQATPYSIGFNESKASRYPLEDEQGRYSWMNFIRAGSNDLRQDRPKLYYPIVVTDEREIRIPKLEWNADLSEYQLMEKIGANEKLIYPIKIVDGKQIEKNWQRGHKRVVSEYSEYRVRKDKDGIINIDFKTRMDDEAAPVTWWDKGEYASANYGATELKNLFVSNPFDFPKAKKLVEDALRSCGGVESGALAIDFFGGSGTTAHASISISRETKARHPYVIVEQGDYFDSVTKPRIAKVIYSADWKEGKPTSPETGLSQLVKIIRLESYEDTLNNLQVKEASAQNKVVAVHPALREDYFLHYLLELETQGSPSLLNVAQFADPTAYTLRVKQAGSDAQVQRVVDLVETFNWLLGLRVSKLFAPQVFAAKFAEERDAELGAEADPRMVLKAPLSPAKSGKNGWWFRTVQGVLADGKSVWVVWRKLTSDPVQDNLVLEAYLREQLGFNVRKQEGTSCALLYVNGSHALPNMPHCEVRQLEEAFHRLMWDVKDV